MGSTIIATQQRGYNKVSTAFPASYATGAGVSTASTTRPATQVVYDTISNNELISLIKFTPFMSASSGSSIGVRLIGWNGYTQSDELEQKGEKVGEKSKAVALTAMSQNDGDDTSCVAVDDSDKKLGKDDEGQVWVDNNGEGAGAGGSKKSLTREV